MSPESTKSTPIPMDPGIYKDLFSTQTEEIDAIKYRRAIGQLHLLCKNSPRHHFCKSWRSSFRCLEVYTGKPYRWVLRYLAGSVHKGPIYCSSNSEPLAAYVDSDFGGCPRTLKSTSGYLLMLAGAPVSWKSTLQSKTAQSTMEAEYVAACLCSHEVVWTGELLSQVGVTRSEPTVLLEDNQACIAFSEASRIKSATKHILLRFHYVREQAESFEIWQILIL